MMMIVWLHVIRHGGFLTHFEPYSFYNVLFHVLDILLCVAVNVFVLISGYFLVNQKFRLTKIVPLLIEVWFYSWISLYVAIKYFDLPIVSKDAYSLLFPISFDQYWFATSYIGLYCTFPILNIIINNVNQRVHGYICASVFIFVSVWEFLVPFANPFFIAHGFSYLWFVCLYFIASYLRRYVSMDKGCKKYLGGYLFASLCSAIIWFVVLVLLKGNPLLFGYDVSTYFYGYNQPLTLLASIFLFMAFCNCRICFNSQIIYVINKVSPLIFGVYLIHDNNILRFYLWSFIKDQFINNNSLIEFIFIGLSIFLLCCLIDLVRKALFDLLYKTKCYGRFIKFITNIFCRVLNIGENKLKNI